MSLYYTSNQLSDFDIVSDMEASEALDTLDTVLRECSRVEIIDGMGRHCVNMRVLDVKFGIQDGGKTLKIFIKDSDPEMGESDFRDYLEGKDNGH